MMKLKMNQEQLEKLIKKYYREELDFEGELKLGTQREYDMHDSYFVPIVVAKGNIQLCEENFEIERTIYNEELKDIIKFYFEKEGYLLGMITFQMNVDYHGDKADCTGAIIEVRQKVKERGGLI